MVSEDKFKDTAWKIINNYSQHNALSEDEEVEKILEQTLVEIEKVMKNKLKRVITVKNLDEENNARLNKRDMDQAAKWPFGKTALNTFDAGDYLGKLLSMANSRLVHDDNKNILSGIYLKLYIRLHDANLNPFLGYLPEQNEIGKRKFAIAIRW